MRLDTASVASLVLSALVADDAATARELGAATGLSTARLRPALRLLLDHGSVVTSGRGAGTRYMLAVVETTRPARVRRARPTIPATVDVMGALEQTAARLAAGATLPELSARPAPTRIVIAEIASEVGTLVPVAQPAVTATSPALHRECATPTEEVAARRLAQQERDAWVAGQDVKVARRERMQQAVLALASVLMVLAPVGWVLAHFAR